MPEAQQKTEKKLTFLDPHAYVPHAESGQDVPDPNKSEICVLLEAVETSVPGIKKVYYAGRMNKYWKDPEFTNPISDAEITALGLPIPAEIENERRKLKKAALESEQDFSINDIIKKTLPKVLTVSERVKNATSRGDAVDLTLARINKGKY